MLEHRRVARISIAFGIVASLWLLAPGTQAEVGAGGTDGVSSYVMKSIVDDTEPMGAVWQRYNSDGPARSVLNDEGVVRGDGNPSLVTSVLGIPVAAWSRNSPAGYDIVVSRFVDGAWSVPVVVAGSPADELDPFLVLDPTNGSMHMLYWVHDASPRVMHSQAPADLLNWTVPAQVSGPSEIACRPAGVFHEGVFRVIYEVHDLGYGTAPRRIVTATSGPSGFTSQMLSMTWHAPANWPQLHSAWGKLWAEWIDSTSEMTWTSQGQAGGWDPVQIEGFGTPESRDYHVRGLIRSLVLE